MRKKRVRNTIKTGSLRLVLPFICCLGIAPAWANADTWAVLVGVSKYQNPQISSLKFPSADAASLRDALTGAKLGRIPVDHVKLLTDDEATGDNIRASVSDFLATHVKSGDSVIVSLAGHGVAKGVGLDAKSYLLPCDVKGLSTPALDSSAVDLRALSQSLGKLPASQFILFIDACREDPTPGRGIKGNQLTDILSRSVQVFPEESKKPASSVTFFACSVGQRAYEDPEFKHGVFTYFILQAITEAALAAPPDGSIEMGRLAGYVSEQVDSWGKKASKSGDFEIDQSPDLLAVNVAGPVTLMRVKRISSSLYKSSAPKLVVGTVPENAVVTVNGNRLSGGPVVRADAKNGANMLKVEAPGYQALERNIEGVNGYQQQFIISLPPSGRGASGGKADEYYKRAQVAEAQEQWEAATAGYQAVISEDPKYVPAYERLTDLQLRQGLPKEAIKTLLDLNEKTTPTVHSYSALARTYARFALKEAAMKPEAAKIKKGGGGLLDRINPFGKKKKKQDEEPAEAGEEGKTGDFRVPKDGPEAALLAQKAAKEALALDANASEAYIAQGFALIASDKMGKHKSDALGAFGKAVFLDPKDATSNYGLGYAIRYFATFEKEDDERKTQVERAIKSFKTALEIRPNFYEAHRELAYCYHLQGQTNEAQKEYESASANRGAATDKDEVAGINVALSTLLQQRALGSSGLAKAGLLAASGGYLSDAKDLSPNLETALRFLKTAGLGRNLTDFLDSPLRGLYNKLPSIPGINFPGLPFKL